MTGFPRILVISPIRSFYVPTARVFGMSRRAGWIVVFGGLLAAIAIVSRQNWMDAGLLSYTSMMVHLSPRECMATSYIEEGFCHSPTSIT